MLSLVMLLVLTGDPKVITSYQSKALDQEGVTTELVMDAEIRQPEALADALIEAGGLTPWNTDQPTVRSRPGSALAYRARYSADGNEIIVYYHGAAGRPVCRIRRRQGGVSSAFNLARRWCATSLGIAVADAIPAPVISMSDEMDQMIRRLDLTSFRNSTGPRRAAGKRTLADYGFSKTRRSNQGATMTSLDGGWMMSFQILTTSDAVVDVCFRDRALQRQTDRVRPSYDATSALRITKATKGYWTARTSPINYPSCRSTA